MKVNNQFDFDDIALRKIGKAVGKRSGKAKRSEVRIWLNTLVAGTVQKLDAPVMRRKREPKKVPAMVALASDIMGRCVHCGQLYRDHIGASKSCPASRSYYKPTRFKGEVAYG